MYFDHTLASAMTLYVFAMLFGLIIITTAVYEPKI